MKQGTILPLILFFASVTLIISILVILDNNSKSKNQNPSQASSESRTDEIGYSEATESVNPEASRSGFDKETTNWKTYTGQVIKISFQHPLDWTVTEEPGVDLGDPNGPVNKSIQLSGNKGISFSIIDNFYGGLPGGTDISSEEIYIDNIKTKKRSYRVTGDGLSAKPSDYHSTPTSAIIDFQRNGKHYSIQASFGWNDADYKEANETINQILSTFKFVE